MITFEQVAGSSAHQLLKCISGSRAYNLQVPTSDTDIKGIFVLPQEQLYGLHYVPQVSNATNDEVYFEIGRFMELLAKNNPNILELLNSPAGSILYQHPLMSLIRPEDYLSRLCLDTFAGYANTQIKKARGLNKKIHRPMEKERKGVMDFCYVIADNSSILLNDWLAAQGYRQEDCGLSGLPHFRDVYLLYHQQQLVAPLYFRGIVSGDDANDVQLSSIPQGISPMAVMNFNKDAYSVYCKEYQEYWEWVARRNEHRYEHTLSLGKNYDAKNMMHTFRLLQMAEEIARYKKIIVFREDRDFLLRIRQGDFEYETLIKMAAEKTAQLETLYQQSDLPDAPDINLAETTLIRIRESFYTAPHEGDTIITNQSF